MTHSIGLPAFQFDDQPVRVVRIDGEPWFVAADVCAALGILNARDAIGKLDDDDKAHIVDSSAVGLTDSTGINHLVNLISVVGLYTLVLVCPDATRPGSVPHRFRKWVRREVLPQIRNAGHYTAEPMPPSIGDRLVAQALAFRDNEHQLADLECEQREILAQIRALVRDRFESALASHS